MIPFVTIYALLSTNNSLFAYLYTPDEIDKDYVIDFICYRCGELPVIYTDPNFLMQQIRIWSFTRKETWERMYLALSTKYKPLDNYNMVEEESESNDTEQETNGENIELSQAFETAKGLTENGKTVGNSELNETRNRDRRLTRSGNIGVTTSAQMLDSECEVRAKWNIYEIIAQEFKAEFCAQIY